MTSLPRSVLSLGLLLALASACSAADPEQSAAVASCRAEADRVYNAQNRYQLSERDSSQSPYSGTGATLSRQNMLADQYARSQIMSDCVRRETGH